MEFVLRLYVNRKHACFTWVKYYRSTRIAQVSKVAFIFSFQRESFLTWARDAALLVEYFIACTGLGFNPLHSFKLGVVVHACNPST